MNRVASLLLALSTLRCASTSATSSPCVDFSKMTLGTHSTPLTVNGLTVHNIFGGQIRIVEDDLIDDKGNHVGVARGVQVGKGFVVKPASAWDVFTIRYVSYQNEPVTVLINASDGGVDEADLVALPQARIKYAATYYPHTTVIGFGGSQEGHIIAVCAVQKSR